MNDFKTPLSQLAGMLFFVFFFFINLNGNSISIDNKSKSSLLSTTHDTHIGNFVRHCSSLNEAYIVADSAITANPANAVDVYVEELVSNNLFVSADYQMLIQAAVDNAVPNTIIYIELGEYRENIVINTNNLTLSGYGNGTVPVDNPLLQTLITGLAPADSNLPGILISNNVTGTTIQDLRVSQFRAGILGNLGNNGTRIKTASSVNNTFGSGNDSGGFYFNGPVDDLLITNCYASGNQNRAIVIWNGLKTNITITGNEIRNSNGGCCGIELQDGTASGVNISGNTLDQIGDNGIGITGLTSGSGGNIISNNTITNCGRFGIEVKLPDGTGLDSGDGSIVVENNNVSRTVVPTDMRDYAGIAVFRRGFLPGNADIPTGVVVRSNSVSGYVQNMTNSNSEGFGIVVEGISHTVSNNAVDNCNVGIQVQAGHLPYSPLASGDGDQSDLDDEYFGRGNTPFSCDITLSGNTFNSNSINTRNVGVSVIDGPIVTNTTTGLEYCSINAAINAAQTINDDTLQLTAGDYIEDGQIVISKDLVIRGDDKTTTTVKPNSNTTDSGDGRAWWLVNDNQHLDLLDMKLDGTGFLTWQAIRHKGYGTIDNVHFTQIKYNESGPHYAGTAIAAFGPAPANNVDVSNCMFDNIGRIGVLYFGTGISGSSFTDNMYTGKGTGDFLDYALDISSGANVTVNDNVIENNQGVASTDGSTSAGVLASTFFGAGTVADLNGNDFSNNSTAIFVGFDNTDASTVTARNNNISGNDYGVVSTNPIVDAMENWWGDATGPSGIGSGNGDSVSENVIYCPWLTMPYSGAPVASIGNVQNTTTGLYYCSIQEAIDAASMNDEIVVSAGTYDEQVIVNKAVTLLGANADVSCGSRTDESIVSPSSGTAFTVTADGVTINGFEITAPASAYAFVCGNTSSLNIVFNNIHDIGTTASGTNVHAINYTVANAATTNDVSISDNCFNNISSSALTGYSASAIGILQSTSTGVLDGLNIERNTIQNVNVNTGTWPTGKIAYGILINVGSNGYTSSNGKVVDAIIKNNEISNLEGFISTAIGLEGNTENAMVENNFVIAIAGHKLADRSGGGYDLQAVKFESNRYVGTCTVQKNSFQTDTYSYDGNLGFGYAIANYVPLASGGVAGTNCNWHGTAVYSEIIDNALLTGKIFNKSGCETTFEPYLLSGTEAAGESTTIGFQPATPNACDSPPVEIVSTTVTDLLCGTLGSIEIVFSGGTGPFNITWTGGSDTNISSPYLISNLSAGLYDITVEAVGSQDMTSAVLEYLPVVNTTGPTYFATIQEAIDAANPGETIEVCEGIYNENITINKSLTINGANAGTAGMDVRLPESVIFNSTVSISGNPTVVFDGFKIERDDDVAGDVVSLGASAEATVTNCVFERNGGAPGIGARAIVTSAGTGIKNISRNLFTGDNSGGLFSGHKTWNNSIWINGSGSTVNITDNKIINTRTALNIDDFQAMITVSGNTFEVNGTQIAFGGTTPTNGQHTLAANDFKTSASAFINLSNVDPAFRLDITSSSYNGTPMMSVPLATLFEIEAQMYHKERSASKKGKVIYKANNQYVNNFTVPGPKIDIIQNSILYADANDIINLQDATFNQSVVIDVPNITLQGATNDKTMHILDGTGLSAGNGITLASDVSGVSIKNITIQNYTGSGSNGSGIFGIRNNDLLIRNVALDNNQGRGGIYLSGVGSGIDNVTIDSVMSSNHAVPASRGIVIWNGFKTNISITDCTVFNNNCCGIELQDGTASGVTITGNNVYDNIDNGIAVLGLKAGAGPNILSNNTISDNGRFGIEIKNPEGTGMATGDGSIVIENNDVSFTASAAMNNRDHAGIGIFRRDFQTGNPSGYVDIPMGVVLENNTVSGYQQQNPGATTSEGFGIVIEGTNHTVNSNTLNNNDIGIQLQGGGHANSNYVANDSGSGDQADGQSPNYFGRGNAPTICETDLGMNNFSGNGDKVRLVTATDLSTDLVYIQTKVEGVIHNQTADTYHCSIQDAVDAASANDVIFVPAGEYFENVVVHTTVTITGPNFGISPNTGTRGAEAKVYPATSESDAIFLIEADNVVIDGLTLDGDNVNVNTGWVGAGTTGVDMDVYDGIGIYDSGNSISVSGVVVKNNILKNIAYFGVDNFGWYNYANPATSEHLIDDNLFMDFGTYSPGGAQYWGGGILLYNDNYTRITNNVMTNVRIGIQTGNFHRANPGDAMYQVMDNNTISARRRGIFYNLHTGNPAPLTLSNNIITGIDDANESSWDGILMSSLRDVSGIATNNSIDGSGVTVPSEGYEIWNVKSDAPALISGGSVNNVDIGVFANNFEGYNSDAADGAHAVVDGLDINPNLTGIGIKVLDSPSSTSHANVQVTVQNNVDLTDPADKGIFVDGVSASLLSSGGFPTATISDHTSYGIHAIDTSLVDIDNVVLTGNGTGLQVDASSMASINNSNITGNTNGVVNTTTIDVDATQNWWGSADGPSGEGSGMGDNISVDVLYCPWLDMPNTGALVSIVSNVKNISNGENFCTIQEAIDDTDTGAGDVIEVQVADHTEPGQIHVTKSVTIQGQGKTVTTVRSNYNTTPSGHGNPLSAWIYTDPGTDVHIKAMTLDASGKDTYTALRFQDGGSVDSVAFNEIKHAASQYLGIAIQIQDGHVDITNSMFTEIGRIGAHFRNGVISGATISGTFQNNMYTGKGAGDYLDYALDISGGVTVDVTSNAITNNKGEAISDGSTSAGILVTTFFPLGMNLANDVTISQNDITNNTSGIVVGFDANDNSQVVANYNNIVGNDTIGIYSEIQVVDATLNWWGNATGPSGEGIGTGDGISANVDYCPWLGALFNGLPGTISGTVKNNDTGEQFCTIQDAIDDGDTDNGDVIEVLIADYTEPGQIHVTKSVTIQGQGKMVTTVRSNYNTASSGHGNPLSAWIYTDPGTDVHIKAMTLDASGKDTYTALRFQDGGSVDNVAFNEIKHSASPYLGIAVQIQDGEVDITNSMFTEIGRIGAHYRNGVIASANISGTFENNMYTGKGLGDYLDYALDISGGVDVDVLNNVITNNLGTAITDGSTSAGILVTTYFPAGMNLANDVTITNNTLSNNTDGIVVGFDANDNSQIVATYNNINGNVDGGISTNLAPNQTIDGTFNWWGHASGPAGAGPGTGDEVSSNVDFCPWLDDEWDAPGMPVDALPVAVCISTNVIVMLDGTGTATITPLDIDNGSYDPCETPTLSLDISSFDCSNIGENTVTLTATDAAMNMSTCTATVIVQDNIDPVMTICAPATTVEKGQTPDPYITGWPTATDNCSVEYTYTDDRSGLLTSGCHVVGDIVRTFTATDPGGNTATCTQIITIEDTQAPTLENCLADLTLSVDENCEAIFNYTIPTSKDLSFYESFEAAGYFPGDSLTLPSIGWNSYNSAITKVPTGTDGINSTQGGSHAKIITGDESFTGAFSRLGGYSTEFDEGFTTQQKIYIDLNDPTVIADTYGWDLSVAVNDQSGGHRRDFIFHAASNASGEVLIGGSNNSNATRRNDLASINHHAITSSGWYTFEWDFKDVADVLVVDLNLKDDTGTILWTETRSNSTDLISTIVGGNRYMWFTFIETQELHIDETLLERNNTVICAGPSSGDVLAPGTYTLTCSTADNCSNSASCATTTITVVDDTPPEITDCPVDVTLNNDPLVCISLYIYPRPSFDDNCGAGSTSMSVSASGGVTIHSSGPDDFANFPVGTTVVTYIATDGNSNKDTCSFSVTVNDTSNPTLSNCPSNMLLNSSAGQCGANATWTAPTANDNCSGVILTGSHNSGDFFPVGITTVTYTATDGVGNTATCSFDVIVEDNEFPAIVCPDDITLNILPGETDGYVNVPLPTVSDNCPGLTYENDFNTTTDASDTYPLGITTVTYTAIDVAGNVTTCNFTITVQIGNEILVSPIVFLQGALYGVSGTVMRDDLRLGSYIPATEPYTDLSTFIHSGGGGGETVDPSVLAVTGDDAIVDWVFVEIREVVSGSPVLATRAALLQRDGDVVDVDGISPVSFLGLDDDNYFVSVRHRNHLGVMGISPVFLSETTTVVDFNSVSTYGTNAQTTINGVRALWAGNTNSNGTIIYQGASNDYDPVLFDVLTAPGNSGLDLNYVFDGYHESDVNMSGETVFQGANNDVDPTLFNVLLYPFNFNFQLNYVILEQLP